MREIKRTKRERASSFIQKKDKKGETSEGGGESKVIYIQCVHSLNQFLQTKWRLPSFNSDISFIHANPRCSVLTDNCNRCCRQNIS